jgi:hypothetical protein
MDGALLGNPGGPTGALGTFFHAGTGQKPGHDLSPEARAGRERGASSRLLTAAKRGVRAPRTPGYARSIRGACNDESSTLIHRECANRAATHLRGHLV